ncbi:MAG: lysoplasmalogenase [Gemmatimonadetes bacterium]|nr:lysoplasmalogenase [Gemmatimonadota bacterium]
MREGQPAASSGRGLTALLIIGALACLAGEYLHLRPLVYVAKPLATIAVLLIAARAVSPVSPRYRALVSAGLAASLAGDVLLMLPGDRFIAGLGSFLVAHLLYIAAFVSEKGGLRNPAAALTIGLFAALMLAMLWPDLGALRLPVSAYVTVIAVMGWQAFARRGRSPGSERAAIGALCFLVSDSALAVSRFRGGFAGSTLVVLGTYWLAQWFISRSVQTHTGSNA